MLRFQIPNMTCGGCAKSVIKILNTVDHTARIETDPSKREVRVDSAASEFDLLAALERGGYPATRQSEIVGD
ncbi:MAG: heavy-metal-associated domain-containing protein [Pseudomonadota bacterium]